MLNVLDETAQLTDLCVCRGTAVPDWAGFRNDHEEFARFPMLRWDRDRLVRQQDAFYELMTRYGVRLHFVPHSDAHPWQMYTRDTAFVIGNRLYFSGQRELPERAGEIDLVRKAVPAIRDEDVVEITSGRIEGGDVLVDGDVSFVGLGTRTAPEAAAELGRHVPVQPIDLGPNVMHLDTRMTILPGRRLLICREAFAPADLAILGARFRMIPVTEAEALAMGTNVFVVDPETVIVHAGFERIARAIEAEGLRADRLDWSEPNALLGSFRCATMPLARA